MSFVDKQFAYFFAIVLLFWFLTRGRYRLRIAMLLVASLFFYGYGRWWWLAIILGYCVVDWGTARWLERTRHPKAVLVLGVGFNLSVLCFWKYTPLLLTTLGEIGASPGTPFAGLAERWVIPMGISFYAFTGISYMVDVYRGTVAAEKSFWRYSLFTTFFPHLVAGPILRAKEFLWHLQPDSLPKDLRASWEGTFLIARGYFKKTVIADNIAVAIDPFFVHVADPSTAGVWSLPYVYLYALQIYFDFSGYTDIARGLGLWFGFRWPENFNWPYLATSIQEFWRRWHMTLSRFLRDYLYIPLGGNRHGLMHTVAALMITMLLGGLWHGASWSFMLWGGLHGLFLVINHLWGLTRLHERLAALSGPRKLLWDGVRMFLTFHAVCFAWCFFRLTVLSESLACVRQWFVFDADKMLAGGAGDGALWLLLSAYGFATLAAVIFVRGVPIAAVEARFAAKPFARGMLWGVAGSLLLLAAALHASGESTPFIYFQF